MAEDNRYILAKLAIKQGDHFQARDHLTSLLKEDQNNIEYWLLLSTVVNSKKERIFCLKRVLELDPRNQEAKLGLILFGALDPGKVQPAEIKKRDWSKELVDLSKKPQPKKEKKKSRYNYKRLIPLLGGGVVLILFLFFSGLLIPGTRSIFSPRLTITPITWTPSVDPALAAQLTGTPNPILQTPIGGALDKPYTPTPVYVLTPHPGYGTYQTALEAYRVGDYETMLTYMKQTANQLETVDIVYMVGEALRHLHRYNEALEQYERALFLDSTFAPAYYGRALVNQVINPDIDIKQDLDQALLIDPKFGQVYIDRAKYYLNREEYQLAFLDADQATQLLPRSHLAHLYRAWSLLEIGDYGEAEKSISTALQIDINHVPSYLVAGRIDIETGNAEGALEKLLKFEIYSKEKTWQLYYSLGKAYYLGGNDFVRAEQLLNEAEVLGGNNRDLYQTRALVYLQLGEKEKALADAFNARNIEKDDFEPNLFLGSTLFESEKYSFALVYLNIAEDLAQNERQLAEVYYWRAFTYENLGVVDKSLSDWRSLLNLPREYVIDEWEFIAEAKLVPTSTPTFTPTFTPTHTPSITPSPTPTSTYTITLTQTNTSTPVPTMTPSQ